ncbi:plant UBX domain-containing protein 7 isoform X2 [Phalaenopsis equestris]|uniref:plant UBX domain-containing protein 7 isoform X2 n=1 Tax=Phalaenopsis equestris TaxID=78828 RepID=UPI0009E37BFE|nr:plant UBX domain-containing protein 7 isoform X2 [Phalaenopsis equestris]
MESLPMATEKQLLVSSFLEIAVGQTAETAIQFLQATSWKLDEAIQLFYVGNDGGGGGISSSYELPPVDLNSSGVESVAAFSGDGRDADPDGVRAPLPVKRDTLYGDASFMRLQPSSVVAFRNFEDESRRPVVWESEQSAASTANGPRDNLASLYRPPFALMYNGSFDKAKFEASLLDKWLLVNLQSTEEFSSHMLNRDTWSNEAVTQTIRTNFIFWQVYSDTSEGKKVCTYYNLVSIPAILVIDPITGQKMRAWAGMVQPERILEDLLPFMEGGPKQQHFSHPFKRRREGAKDSTDIISEKHLEEDEELLMAVAASLEGTKAPVESCVDVEVKAKEDAKTSSSEEPLYPPLPEEPKGNRELVCRVGIRLPDGRRVQRSFLHSDSIKLLWSFCSSEMEEAGTRPFHFTQAIPGASKTLDFESNLTFDEAGLSNSLVSMLWD